MKTVILLSGHLQNGKSTLSDFLKEEFTTRHHLTVTQDAFANGVKTGSRDDFKPLVNFINNHIDRIKAQLGALFSLDKTLPMGTLGMVDGLLDQLKTNDDNWFEQKTPITRLLLQAYGTQIFRNRVDKGYWAKQTRERFLKSKSDITIISDCRFPIECEVFNNSIDYNVITIRIDRKLPLDPVMSKHESETALDSWEGWNYIVDNNSSLNDLKITAKTIAYDILGLNEIKEEKSYLFV